MTTLGKINFSPSMEHALVPTKPANSFTASITHPLKAPSAIGNNVLSHGLSFSSPTSLLSSSHSTNIAPPSTVLSSVRLQPSKLATEMTHQTFKPVDNLLTRLATEQVQGPVNLVRSIAALPENFKNAVNALASGNIDVHALNETLRTQKNTWVQSKTPENVLAEIKNNGLELMAGAGVGLFGMTKLNSFHSLNQVMEQAARNNRITLKSGVRPDGSIPPNSHLSTKELAHERNRARALSDHQRTGQMDQTLVERESFAKHLSQQNALVDESLKGLNENLKQLTVKLAQTKDLRQIELLQSRITELKQLQRHVWTEAMFRKEVQAQVAKDPSKGVPMRAMD